MTNERITPDPGAASDERVAAAYRDLANERAPDELNAAVLRKAAQAARPRYQRSILWTRPVAWAAVVAISLAITLQVTQVPVPNEVPAVRQLQESDAFDPPPARNEQEVYRDRQAAEDLPAGRSAPESNSKTEERIVPGILSVDTANVPEKTDRPLGVSA